MADTSTTKSLALISQYLYSVQIAQDKAFKGGSINSDRDMVLYMQRKALEYGINQSLSGLQGVANNVYALIGSKLQLANEILSTGSSGIVVNPSSGSGSLTPISISHAITVGESGVMTLTNAAWIGLQGVNFVIINQSILQAGSQFTFNSVTGTFYFNLYNYILQAGDVITSSGFLPV